MRPKVSIVGAGNVGATCASYIAQSGLADVMLLDIVEGMPQGKALDILQACSPLGVSCCIGGSNDFADLGDSHIVVITAGLARKPGMSRLDLQKTNAEIIGGIIERIVEHAPNSMIVMVTNPIDVLTYHAFKRSGFPANRVFGQAGVLDSARMAAFVALELGVDVTTIQAMVLGGHGDSMVPLPRFSTVSGVPITELIPADRIEAISDRTRKGGGEIVNLLKTGSAYYAPAASTARMVKAVLLDRKELMPCSAYLTGQYGINDLYIGVPIKLGANGVEEILELKLNDEELAMFKRSAESYKESLAHLG